MWFSVRVVGFCVAAFLCGPASATLLPAPRAGQAIEVKSGSLQVSEVTSKLSRGDPVYSQARIETDETGFAKLLLDDGARLEMGSLSKVVIDEYVYRAERGAGAAALTLMRGMLRIVSGRMPSRNVTVTTPTADIGLRGTDFTLTQISPWSLLIHVHAGEVIASPARSPEHYRFVGTQIAVCTATSCVQREDETGGPPRQDLEPAPGDDLSSW
ncbi:MAG: FecR domain-containing protein [Pseudomonadota bacterium]